MTPEQEQQIQKDWENVYKTIGKLLEPYGKNIPPKEVTEKCMDLIQEQMEKACSI